MQDRSQKIIRHRIKELPHSLIKTMPDNLTRILDWFEDRIMTLEVAIFYFVIWLFFFPNVLNYAAVVSLFLLCVGAIGCWTNAYLTVKIAGVIWERLKRKYSDK